MILQKHLCIDSFLFFPHHLHPSFHPSPRGPNPSGSSNDLVHSNHPPNPLHHLNDLLRLLLRHPLLHLLRRALHKLLAVHQTQPQHALDLLDDLRLRPRVDRLQRECEQGLFLRGGRGFFLLFDGRGCWGGGSGATGGEVADGHVGDVEAGLVAGGTSVRSNGIM